MKSRIALLFSAVALAACAGDRITSPESVALSNGGQPIRGGVQGLETELCGETVIISGSGQFKQMGTKSGFRVVTQGKQTITIKGTTKSIDVHNAGATTGEFTETSETYTFTGRTAIADFAGNYVQYIGVHTRHYELVNGQLVTKFTTSGQTVDLCAQLKA